ncbi:LpqB family beta-propeller domain-containing protein [Microbacterium resistens]|uniref:LpqB family beta-propeller domain-containing protein n=1 Tax=Microbacterium resistens TaxID=156977 RepID=UPI0008324FFF|nr:LpqB family beta-propeller domain-containing protein [Microbacterium resistens]
MSVGRVIRSAVVALLALSLAACASLPTTGEVRPGNSGDGASDESDLTYLARGPSDGADPEQIVRGFIDAAANPADNWDVARSFLIGPFQESWKPNAGATIDASAERRYAGPTPEADTDETSVRLAIQQSATIDQNGSYSVASGAAEVSYELKKDDAGQWRIARAPDGILLDARTFAAEDVLRPYPVVYFDATWTYLVPDVRWFPKRKNTASRIVQALVAGAPSPWLVESVRTAFTGDVELGRETVSVDAQIAEVDLSQAALGVDDVTLARMRTQLERSLAAVGVLQVRLTVNGTELGTSAAPFSSTTVDTRPLVLTEDGFGYLSGSEVSPIDGVSGPIARFPEPISSITASGAASRAIVQTTGGRVYAVSGEQVDELDSRPGLIRPSLDPYGFTWTVPRTSPGGVQVWSPAVVSHPLPAFEDAQGISALAVSRDGARVAVALSVGSQVRIEVAGIERDAKGEPTGVGRPYFVAGRVPGEVRDLVWLDDRTLGILAEDDGRPELIEQMVGGPSTTTDTPVAAQAVAPAAPVSNVRLRGDDGALWMRSGTTWSSERAGVQVLATQIDSP